MKREHCPPQTRWYRTAAAVLQCSLVAGLIISAGPARAESQLVPCSGGSDARTIAAALLAIQRSADPCGESAQLIGVLERLKACTTSYKICVDTKSSRNLFEPPIDSRTDGLPRTITWNPELRSALETDDDSLEASVHRDPTASLVHELAHAVQDCDRLNPGEHELEAVRIENIYRRAAGLPQRCRYGSVLLPAEMVKICTPGWCPCSASTDPDSPRGRAQQTTERREFGSASSGDAEPVP